MLSNDTDVKTFEIDIITPEILIIKNWYWCKTFLHLWKAI